MSAPPRRPSIVFITTDTQGREMLSAYVTRPGVETPRLDQFAHEGVLFENCFTTSPVCTPARSAWYTGLYPNRNGAWANELAPSRHVPLLADLLTAQGYAAFHVGKWHLDAGGYNGRGVSDGGFDANAWYDLRNFMDEVGREGPNKFGGWNRGLDDPQYCFGRRVADRAIDVLAQHSQDDRPLFLCVSFDEPHGPYICPPPFRGRLADREVYTPPTLKADLTDKPRLQQAYSAFLTRDRRVADELPAYYRKYYECNSYIDDEIGRVLDAIDQYCPADTIVIFTSDHGDHLGAFGLSAKGPTMYDHTTAVPLIIRAPALSEGGRRVAGLVSAVDVWATIVDLAGVGVGNFNVADGYVGQSLLPVLTGQTPAVREAVIVEYNRFGLTQSQVDGFYPIRCIRTADWKLSLNLFDRDELYNLRADPHEAVNLIDAPPHQAVRVELHDRLLAWQTATRDPFRSPQWGQRPWRPDYKHTFEGLFTTGYKDQWTTGKFR